MENQKVNIALDAVQETLIMPLWARAQETKKKNPIIRDEYARDLVDRIDYDFSKFESNPELAENQQLQWAIRTYHFDHCIREFFVRNSHAVIINIGAGLDTAYHRIADRGALWVNIDLPDAAALRRKLIPDTEEEITIAKSVFDFSWIDDLSELTRDRCILFTAAGVLFYFSPSEIESLFRRLADAYPGAHFVFDAVTSRWILWLTNRAIMRKSGMDSSVRLKWHLKKGSHLKKYLGSVKVVEEHSMFSNVPSTEGLSRKLLRDLKIGKLLRVYSIVHVQF
jgi:O-methyltransferase involved in polyketide biosynthesis